MSLVFGQNVDLDSIPAKAYFDTDVEINLEGYEDSNLTWSWVIEKPDGSLFTDPSDDNNTILTFMPNALGFNETGIYTIRVEFDDRDVASSHIPEFTQLYIARRTNEEEVIVRTYAPFISEITSITFVCSTCI